MTTEQIYDNGHVTADYDTDKDMITILLNGDGISLRFFTLEKIADMARIVYIKHNNKRV